MFIKNKKKQHTKLNVVVVFSTLLLYVKN